MSSNLENEHLQAFEQLINICIQKGNVFMDIQAVGTYAMHLEVLNNICKQKKQLENEKVSEKLENNP